MLMHIANRWAVSSAWTNSLPPCGPWYSVNTQSPSGPVTRSIGYPDIVVDPAQRSAITFGNKRCSRVSYARTR